MTGVDSNGVVPVDETADDTHGQYALVAPGVKAPFHQHFFNFRLDFDIDGGPMRAREVHNEPTGSERNGRTASERRRRSRRNRVTPSTTSLARATTDGPADVSVAFRSLTGR